MPVAEHGAHSSRMPSEPRGRPPGGGSVSLDDFGGMARPVEFSRSRTRTGGIAVERGDGVAGLDELGRLAAGGGAEIGDA